MIDSDYSNEVYERRGKKYAPEPRNDRDISYLPHPSWKTKKHYEFNKEPQYYNMEGYMNRKGRVLTRDEFRNSIPEGNPGDKYYKQADREPDFYKKGGLIVGSTMRLRESAKPLLRKSATWTQRDTSVQLTKMPHKEKLLIQAKREDIEEVLSLNNSKIVIGQKLPSWEQRTGQIMVEDDNDD